MNCGSSHTPVCLLDATQPEKPGRFFLRIAQARGATAVKQVGVLHRRQNCEEALYASGLRIFRCQAAAEAQRGQPDVECDRKAGGSLRPRTACAKLAQRIRSMAMQRDGSAQYRVSPSPGYGRGQNFGAPKFWPRP